MTVVTTVIIVTVVAAKVFITHICLSYVVLYIVPLTKNRRKRFPCSFSINILVTEVTSTPFNVKKHEVLSQKIFGSEILPMANQLPCKDIKLNNKIAHPRSLLRN